VSTAAEGAGWLAADGVPDTAGVLGALVAMGAGDLLGAHAATMDDSKTPNPRPARLFAWFMRAS
jgi:hypothetical protein